MRENRIKIVTLFIKEYTVEVNKVVDLNNNYNKKQESETFIIDDENDSAIKGGGWGFSESGNGPI